MQLAVYMSSDPVAALALQVLYPRPIVRLVVWARPLPSGLAAVLNPPLGTWARTSKGMRLRHLVCEVAPPAGASPIVIACAAVNPVPEVVQGSPKLPNVSFVVAPPKSVLLIVMDDDE